MFGFLPFRNISKSGSLTAVAACVALSAAWLALDEEERGREAARNALEDERARAARRRWAAAAAAPATESAASSSFATTIGPANRGAS